MLGCKQKKKTSKNGVFTHFSSHKSSLHLFGSWAIKPSDTQKRAITPMNILGRTGVALLEWPCKKQKQRKVSFILWSNYNRNYWGKKLDHSHESLLLFSPFYMLHHHKQQPKQICVGLDVQIEARWVAVEWTISVKVKDCGDFVSKNESISSKGDVCKDTKHKLKTCTNAPESWCTQLRKGKEGTCSAACNLSLLQELTEMTEVHKSCQLFAWKSFWYSWCEPTGRLNQLNVISAVWFQVMC